MPQEKMKYKDLIEESRKIDEALSPEAKEAREMRTLASCKQFAEMMDILKAIEKKYNIDVMSIARKIRWNRAYQEGRKAARNYEKNGIKEYYLAVSRAYEVRCDFEWFEFNDNRSEKHCRKCPPKEAFRKLGRTEQEMKEWASLFCLQDEAFPNGFNPEFEVAIPRLQLKGDPHCTYIHIHHWEK